MSKINQVIAEVSTGNDSNAGTDSYVYLGIAGREFSLDIPNHNSFEPGKTDKFILGEDHNVVDAEYVDPRNPQLLTEDLRHYPAYIRMDPRGRYPGWQVERVTVTVKSAGPDRTFDNLRLEGAAKIWLHEPYGLKLYLTEIE